MTALSRRLIDESVAEYHSVVQIYFHPVYSRQPPVNNTYTVPWLEATLRHCRDRGVAMPNTDEWAAFVVARHAVRLAAVRWAPAAAGLDCILERRDW
ncbi:MAG: hypothetical protein HY332_25040 [Chloroflexi bacterium]|nr:hypothetical protein [Chloroflexota bacterium]